jgi:molybdopterin synthase sulfur carrier subunit
MATYKLLLFGLAKDLVGAGSLTWESANANLSVKDFMDELHSKYPSLADISTLLVAVNEEYAEPNQQLFPNDTIALIPPVSGG